MLTKLKYVFLKKGKVITILFGRSMMKLLKFKYLGVTISYNGSMKHAVDVLKQQAFNHLLSLFYRVQMDFKTKLRACSQGSAQM